MNFRDPQKSYRHSIRGKNGENIRFMDSPIGPDIQIIPGEFFMRIIFKRDNLTAHDGSIVEKRF